MRTRRATPPRRARAIDIIFLVERLESVIANGKPLPLTKNAIIDRDAALNLIDELRLAVPEEVRAAKRINQEGERIIEKAEEEAERTVARAQEQAAFLIEERGLTEAADAESGRIIARAADEADAIRNGADAYARGVLTELEDRVTRTLSSISRGIEVLDERRAQERAADDAPGAATAADGAGADAADVAERGSGGMRNSGW